MDGADIQAALGPINLVVAGLGAGLAIAHARFMHRSSDPFARRIRNVFITDALIYTGAILTGLWFFFEFRGPDAWAPVNILKTISYALNTLASARLFYHYPMVRRRE